MRSARGWEQCQPCDSFRQTSLSSIRGYVSRVNPRCVSRGRTQSHSLRAPLLLATPPPPRPSSAAVRLDLLPQLAPASASARDMVPPHTIAGIIYSLCATSAAAALKPSLIAARRSTHRVPCARGGGQPHSRTERRFWISAAREHSERTSRVLSLPRSRRHFAKSTVAL